MKIAEGVKKMKSIIIKPHRTKMGQLGAYYSIANRKRAELTSAKWRITVIALVLIAILVVHTHLNNKYGADYVSTGIQTINGVAEETGYVVLEKVFYWFMAGFFVGALALAVMYEGDFIIGLWRLGRKLEQESLKKIQKNIDSKNNARKRSRK